MLQDIENQNNYLCILMKYETAAFERDFKSKTQRSISMIYGLNPVSTSRTWKSTFPASTERSTSWAYKAGSTNHVQLDVVWSNLPRGGAMTALQTCLRIFYSLMHQAIGAHSKHIVWLLCQKEISGYLDFNCMVHCMTESPPTKHTYSKITQMEQSAQIYKGGHVCDQPYWCAS